MYTVSDPASVCSINPDTKLPEATGLGPRSPNYRCEKLIMRSGTMWLGIWAGVLIVLLTYYEVRGRAAAAWRASLGAARPVRRWHSHHAPPAAVARCCSGAPLCRQVKAAIMYGVLFATIISWIPGTAVSYLTSATPGGEERFAYFRKVVTIPDPSKTSLQLDWAGLANGDAWVALVTFL